MKKIIFCLAIVVLLFPAGIFAAPSEQDVADAVGGVMSVFGLSMMAAMFGAELPDGSLEVETSGDGTINTFRYKNFPAKTFLEGMKGMMAQMSEPGEENELVCHFDYMSGTIVTTGDMTGNSGQVDIDVSLKGGSVKTLEMRLEDSIENSYLKANGKRYKNMEKIFADAGFDDSEE